MYAIFNLDKKFLSYSEQELNGNFLNKKIPDDKTNLLEWAWSGDYDRGEMVKIDKSDYEIINNIRSFESNYPFYFFMSKILKQIYMTSKKNNTLSDDFEKMTKEFIFCFEKPENYMELLKLTNKL